MPKKPTDIFAQVGRYSGMALVIPSSCFVGYVIGYLLDKLFHTSFLRPVFLIIGVISGFVELVRELKKDFPDQ